MTPTVALAASTITVAFVLYTLGVFWERHEGRLRGKHLALFWAGFAFDTTGTSIMAAIAQSAGGPASASHAASGMLAIALMLFHAVWATFVLLRGSERAASTFHRLSVVVWLVWLVPYISGMLAGMPMVHLSPAANACAAFGIPFLCAIALCLQANAKRRRTK